MAMDSEKDHMYILWCNQSIELENNIHLHKH